MSGILEAAPNPQFARVGWLDLTGTWKFRFDDTDTGLQAGWWAEEFAGESLDIIVPFPPESELSGIGDPSFHPWVWYQRSLPSPAIDARERTLIHFGAVDHAATVWIGGIPVGQHVGGSSPFTIDVSTEWLRSLEKPLITVRVFDDPEDLEQPRGKQGWKPEPESIWYKRTTGIWQPVWLETAPATYVTHVHWVYSADTSELYLDVELNRRPTQAVEIDARVFLPDGRELGVDVIAESRHPHAIISLKALANAGELGSLLWSPHSPTLLPTELRTSNGDMVRGYIGLRSLSLDVSGFCINNQSVWLAMVLSQGYFPQSLYAAPSADAIREEVELTLALGFNGARTHQKAEDPRYLYHADRLGLLVWGEIGAAQEWSDRAIELLSSEWRELVRRDINHPSIIAWVPFNESWGINQVSVSSDQQHGVRSLYALTNALDGTRPVIGNDGWEHVSTDIFSLHDYHWDGEELARRYSSGQTNQEIASDYAVAGKQAVAVLDLTLESLPLMITEYGGVSFVPSQDESWYGYGSVSDEAEFVDKYRELTAALQESRELIGMCYTQLTDTEQETNGLLYADRTPKIDMSVLGQITRGDRTR